MLATDSPAVFISPRDRFRSDLLRSIEQGTVRCGVIGLGFIGSVLLNALIEAGLTARGFDRAQAAVDRFSEHRAQLPGSRRSGYRCAADSEVIVGCDVIFVAVRNLLDGATLDDEPLRSAAELIERHAQRPCLVILESTVPPGTTRLFAEAIGADDDAGLFVAHAPERLSAGHDHRTLRATPHLVAGIDADATELAAAMLKRVCDTVVIASVPEVTELSKLLENAFLSVNIGLTTEVTRLCISLGISAHEVCRAAASKTQGFMPFYPGPGVGGHCLPNDLMMLAGAARSRGWEPELLAGTIAVNERAPRLVVARVEALLHSAGIPMKGSTVLLVGVGFKTGSPDTTRSPAFDVVRSLRERGAWVAYADSLCPGFTVDGLALPQMAAEQLEARQFTVGILLSGDRNVSDQQLLTACGVVLDAAGSRQSRPVCADMATL